MIPLNDLIAQYHSLKAEIDRALSEVIDGANFIGGSFVKDFEESYSGYIGKKHCISCGNGTDALEILLQAFDIGPGDEVLVPAVSWIATSEAVSSTGAVPVFVDVDKHYYTIDEDIVERYISERTRAIIPVHLYGQVCDMDKLNRVASKHNLIVIEDCAQAHGASWKGKKAGSLGHAAAFSFYPGKILGAFGDAGCMLTDMDEIADRARMIANHGQIKKHHHLMEGRNSRMDALQAAVLSVKLKYLDHWVERRREIAGYYREQINNKFISVPRERPDSRHAYHLFVLRSTKRAQIRDYLHKNKIQSAVHYPRALPFLDCYSGRNYTADDFPNAAKLQNEVLSIPIFPEMPPEMTREVVENLNYFE